MNTNINNSYHSSTQKMLLDKLGAASALFFFFPITVIITLVLKFFNHGPVFYIQKRVGKNGKIFELIKFRTMKLGAEKLQRKLKHLNEADGPVFKIINDPRYTALGKFLAHTGLDELPQLINVLKGEMSLVGPRPLPVHEASELTKSQKIRELVRPGITSSWVVEGAHALTFNQWMRLDREYVQNANLKEDIRILAKTGTLIVRQVLKTISRAGNEI